MINKTATTANFKSMSLSLQLGGWKFTPGLIPTLAVILLLPLLCSLGVWQLHRAVAKQQLLDQFALRSQQKPQPLANDELIYTPVQVSGRFDSAHLLLLDNRIVNGVAGYDVLVPFLPDQENFSPDGRSPAILVNLGWIPRSACHAQSAMPPVPLLTVSSP
jgi:surfeit locus 1 family protein